MRTHALIAAAGLVALAFLPAAAFAGKDWKQTFEQGLKSGDSNVRHAAVAGVEPDDKGGVKALLHVVSLREMNTVDWHIRAAAIARLAAATDEKAIAEIAKALAAKDPLVREAAALALGRMKHGPSLDGVTKLLDDKDAGVRRAAVRALADYRSMKSVDALIARWEKLAGAKGGADYREERLIADALEAITELRKPRWLEEWKGWWAENKAGFKRASDMTAEERKAAEEAAKKAETELRRKEEFSTTLRDMPVTFTVEGQGTIPLLVIHDDSWNPNYLDPYLAAIDDICRIFYVSLPPLSKLDQSKLKKDMNGGMVYYPYEQLCEAFEEIRKQYAKDRFAILAHGFSTTVAARYLSKYGENVSHAILVGCFPGDDAYGNMLDRLSAKATGHLKDRELDNAVKFHFINDTKTKKKFYEPKTNEELEALERKFFSIMFANPQDPEIEEIWLRCRKPGSMDLKVNFDEMCLSPPFDIMREKKPTCPVLVISGAKSIWFGVADGDRVAKNYPSSQHVVLKESAMMPWFDEPAAFEDAVRKFFAKHPYEKPGETKKGEKATERR